MRTGMNRCTLLAVVCAVVIGSSSPGLAQGSNDWAVDQA
jgi:hypothetical protein